MVDILGDPRRSSSITPFRPVCSRRPDQNCLDLSRLRLLCHAHSADTRDRCSARPHPVGDPCLGPRSGLGLRMFRCLVPGGMSGSKLASNPHPLLQSGQSLRIRTLRRDNPRWLGYPMHGIPSYWALAGRTLACVIVVCRRNACSECSFWRTGHSLSNNRPLR